MYAPFHTTEYMFKILFLLVLWSDTESYWRYTVFDKNILSVLKPLVWTLFGCVESKGHKEGCYRHPALSQ